MGQLLGSFWGSSAQKDAQPAPGAASGGGGPGAKAASAGAVSSGGQRKKQGGLGGLALGLWESAADQLMNLEAKIVTQASLWVPTP